MNATKAAQILVKRVVSSALIMVMYVTVIAAGWFLAYLPAQAGDLTVISDTLTNSEPASSSNHTLTFTVLSQIPAGGSISIDFQANIFATGSVAFDDVDVASSADYTLAAVAAAGTLGVTISGHELHIAGLSTVSASTVLTVEIGTNATSQTTGDDQLSNPSSTGSKQIVITTYNASGGTLDSGTTLVAIVNAVTLNAVVAANFTFVIDGMLTSESIDSQLVASQSEDSYVGFGTLTAGTPILMGSSLSVSTNAANGFVVTVQQNHNLLASSGADIDCFTNGACTDPASGWTSPTGTLGNENTYGHFGITTEDASTISKTTSVSSTTNGDFIGLVSQTPDTIWSVSGVADGVTQDIGHIDVGYRIEITALQEAGRYQNRLMYIATPTF